MPAPHYHERWQIQQGADGPYCAACGVRVTYTGDDRDQPVTDTRAALNHTERAIADAIVGIVCHCGPQRHTIGFPQCETARSAARAALDVLDQPARRVGTPVAAILAGAAELPAIDAAKFFEDVRGSEHEASIEIILELLESLPADHPDRPGVRRAWEVLRSDRLES